MKDEIYESCPFTPIPEGSDEIEFRSKKRNKGSKYKRVRKLVIK